MEEYKRFLAIWECIRQMNNKGIYLYGYAAQQDGNYKVEFSCDSEKENYKAVFGL
jgi:hypothetical protein